MPSTTPDASEPVTAKGRHRHSWSTIVSEVELGLIVEQIDKCECGAVRHGVNADRKPELLATFEREVSARAALSAEGK